MSVLVPRDDIERIVGVKRRHRAHVGRAVSPEQQVYVLHSHGCRGEHDNGTRDLRDCPYSVALAAYGINERDWIGLMDRPVVLGIDRFGVLVPIRTLGGSS